MSFNKRYIDIKSINGHIVGGDFNGLEKLFSDKIDVFIYGDDISCKIHNLFKLKEFTKIRCLLRCN